MFFRPRRRNIVNIIKTLDEKLKGLSNYYNKISIYHQKQQ